MKSVKFVETLAVEFDKSGFFMQGHLTDEGELVAFEEIEKKDGKETLSGVLKFTEGAPIASIWLNRNLLLKILIEMDTEDFFNMQIFAGERAPVILANEEEFAILMPAVKDATKVLDIKLAAGIEEG